MSAFGTLQGLRNESVFSQRHSGLGLVQHRHNLFDVESFLLHSKSPFAGF
jgi:hypothetical protein